MSEERDLSGYQEILEQAVELNDEAAMRMNATEREAWANVITGLEELVNNRAQVSALTIGGSPTPAFEWQITHPTTENGYDQIVAYRNGEDFDPEQLAEQVHELIVANLAMDLNHAITGSQFVTAAYLDGGHKEPQREIDRDRWKMAKEALAEIDPEREISVSSRVASFVSGYGEHKGTVIDLSRMDLSHVIFERGSVPTTPNTILNLQDANLTRMDMRNLDASPHITQLNLNGSRLQNATLPQHTIAHNAVIDLTGASHIPSSLADFSQRINNETFDRLTEEIDGSTQKKNYPYIALEIDDATLENPTNRPFANAYNTGEDKSLAI